MAGVRFIVIEHCDDYEQVLSLAVGAALPKTGILTWATGTQRRHAFGTRREARDAINRTEHYRLAFGRNDLPERKFCKVAAINTP